MILVTGATGNVGSEVVSLLSQAGVPVRATARDLTGMPALPSVEWVQADFTNPASLDKALQGVDKVVLISPAHIDMVSHQSAVIDAASKAGARHIVKLSGLGAGPDAPIRLPRNHYEIENRIIASGLDYTFVRPNLFMQVLIGSADSIESDGAIYAPAGDAAISFTDVRDVAATIVASLTDPYQKNAVLEITGPAALTYAQAADQLGQAIGKPVKYVAVEPETARKAMTAGGMDGWLVEAFLELFSVYRAGHGVSVLSDTIKRVTGYSANTLADFARRNQAQFTAAA